MADKRQPFTKKKKKKRQWYDRSGKPHEKTTNFITGIRKRDKQHKR